MSRNQVEPEVRLRRVAMPTQAWPRSSPDGLGSRPRLSELLVTKLAVPQLPPGLVARQRLIDRVAAGVKGPVTLVIAGPGWGKTQLVASWAMTDPGPVAWLSLDSYDNDPVVFWSYVLAALRATGEVATGSRLDGLSLSAPIGEDQLQRIMVGLAALPRPVTLVLDDWQEIRDSGVVSGLAAVLHHALPLRLVLISRSDPRLRLQRLHADGGLTEIRTAELAFTPSEAEDLLRKAAVGLPAAQRQALLERTEGWAIGLRLAAQFAARPGYAERIAEFVGDERTVAEYLVDEVLRDMPPEGQRFLLRTSVAERVCGELADVLTDGTDGQRQLEAMEQANAFVVALGPGRRWFRYHALLADLLRHQLLLDEPDLLPELHRRAARWYADRGEALEALRHAARATDWQLFAELIVSMASMRAVSAERQALAAVLAEIPQGELQASAELRICAALKRFIARDYSAMAHEMAQARAMLDGRDPKSHRQVVVLLRTMDLVLSRVGGDMPGIVDAATDLLAWVSDGRAPVLPAAAEYEAAALTNRGHALFWLGQTDAAERDLRAGRAVAEDAGLQLTLVNALGSLALLELDQSGCRTASSTALGALAIAEPRGWTGLLQTAIVYLTLAAIQLECDDLAEAQRLLDLGLAAQRNDPERSALCALNVIQARVLVAGGQYREAHSAIEDSTRTLEGWSAPPLLRQWLAGAEAELDLATGDPRACLGRIGLSPSELAANVGPLTTLAARAHIALGEMAEAEALLTPARQRASNAVVAVEAWLLTALSADHAEDEARAVSALERSLTIAQPENIRRPFVAFDGPRVHAMLRQRAPVSAALEPFVHDLLARLLDSRHVTPPVVPLTPRERAVLVHLARMQTNEEIASDLFVSINTVKAHAISVYRKLGVANRREAVLRARDLGLL